MSLFQKLPCLVKAGVEIEEIILPGWRCVVQKKKSVTRPCIAVLKKDLLCRHIELSKGVKQCRKSLLQMF